MSDKRQCLKIGEVLFHLNPEPELVVLTSSQFYDDFIVCDAASEVVKVTFIFGRIPETGHMKVLFNTESSWILLAEGRQYFLRLDDGRTGKPFIVARFRSDVTEVTFFCSSELLTEGGTAQNPFCYPLDQVILMYYLATRSGAIIHSAGMVFDQKGYLFPGWSGAGKTTLSRHFISRQGFEVLSDDRTIVRKRGLDFTIFGTPWPGDAGIAKNKSAPLQGIFFIVQSHENKIERIEGGEALRRLMPVVSAPWYDNQVIKGIFSFAGELIAQVPSYLLFCSQGKEAGDLVEDFISAD